MEKKIGSGMEKIGYGIRDGKNSDPGWKKFGSGMEKIRIREGKNSDPGSKINIPDPQPRGFNRSALPCRSLVEKKAASGQATAHRLHTVSSTTIASLGTVLSHHSSGHFKPMIQ